MSISEVVDAEYRLHAADLEGRPQRMVIANVSYQGVEQLAPVLHFEDTAKRLVLTPYHVRRLVNLSGTPIFSKWIGITVVLESSHVDGADVIGIAAAESSPYALDAARGDAGARLLALAIVGLLAFAALLYAVSNLLMIR